MRICLYTSVLDLIKPHPQTLRVRLIDNTRIYIYRGQLKECTSSPNKSSNPQITFIAVLILAKNPYNVFASPNPCVFASVCVYLCV